ncbi:hypothetical protein NDU88_004695 [Pleurodeles waltl]|uniref:Uncharacterized protein n=1 Tax=Pleurodeles waltl TaxID=8319 RepID=A0AAV7LIV6_PLEWA|nr:hypothetical protein NDU88_004695 [Pleurodeles waltl]
MPRSNHPVKEEEAFFVDESSGSGYRCLLQNGGHYTSSTSEYGTLALQPKPTKKHLVLQLSESKGHGHRCCLAMVGTKKHLRTSRLRDQHQKHIQSQNLPLRPRQTKHNNRHHLNLRAKPAVDNNHLATECTFHPKAESFGAELQACS